MTDKDQKIEAFKSNFIREEESARRAGELKKFLEQRGFSAGEAEYITDGLIMYRVSDLQYLIPADIRQYLPDLSTENQQRLMRLANTAKQCISDIKAGYSLHSSWENEYLISK